MPLDCTPILEAYPERGRVAKFKALRAIAEALDAIEARGTPAPTAWLLGRVRAFAASPLGQSRFTPHAANWFADGRYDDPDAAWQENHDDKAERTGKADQRRAARRDGEFAEAPIAVPTSRYGPDDGGAPAQP